MNSIGNPKLVNYVGPVMICKPQGECLLHVISLKLCQAMGSLMASVSPSSETPREVLG